MATVDVPPSYEEALKLIDSLKKTPPSAEKLAHAHQAMAREAADPKTHKILMKEIRNLAGAAIQISNSFEKVRLDLLRVDKNEYKNKDGTPVAKLAPGWTILQDRYTQIHDRSRTTASVTAAQLKDFSNTIVPSLSDPRYSFEDRLAELNVFANRQRTNGASAEDIAENSELLSEAFKTLRDDVKAYGQKFDNFAEEQKVLFTDRVKELKDEMKKLEKEIKEQEDAIFAAGVTMGSTAFGVGMGAIGALVAMGPAGPVAAIGIVLAGLATLGAEAAKLVGYIKKQNDTRIALTKVDRELKQITEDLKELVQLRTVLDSCKLEVGTIVARIDQFAIVWALVARDANIIANDMKAAGKTPNDQDFLSKVELLRASYGSLGDALSYYGTVTRITQTEGDDE